MKLLTDPRLFNVVLIALNCGAAIRWGLAGNAMRCLYWCAAALLNVSVTFGAVK